ncbi:MAG: N-carbamoylputrescine amidase [Pseudomonadota bacterium]
MVNITLAVTQMACGPDWEVNLSRAEDLVRRAADRGANIVLLQELFLGPYFCKDQLADYFDWARPRENHPALERLAGLARDLDVVIPVSFFERAGQAYFNSLALLDAGGKTLGIYRKTHIPDGPGYQEKYYFSPGDTGFRVFDTKFGRVGAAICWDQWFPETARSLALLGAEVLLFPTAIGSEPLDPTWDSSGHWTRVQQGHAAANIMPLCASNRVGMEKGRSCDIEFFGSSFIAGPTGEIVVQAGRTEETVLTATFDLDEIRRLRSSWGLFRDRRPEKYGPILTLDGKS